LSHRIHEWESSFYAVYLLLKSSKIVEEISCGWHVSLTFALNAFVPAGSAGIHVYFYDILPIAGLHGSKLYGSLMTGISMISSPNL